MPSRYYIARELAKGLFETAEAAARATALAVKKSRRLLGPRRKPGLTLRPGGDTPLWNELVRQTLPLLGKRGSKARLARFLRLPRQRMQDCLKARQNSLDAERTLLLLCWVSARQQGRDLNV
jgi:hypothetical protein